MLVLCNCSRRSTLISLKLLNGCVVRKVVRFLVDLFRCAMKSTIGDVDETTARWSVNYAVVSVISAIHFFFYQYSAIVENPTPSPCTEILYQQNNFFILCYRWGTRTERCFFLEDSNAHKVNWLSEADAGASFCLDTLLNLLPADRGS